MTPRRVRHDCGDRDCDGESFFAALHDMTSAQRREAFARLAREWCMSCGGPAIYHGIPCPCTRDT